MADPGVPAKLCAGCQSDRTPLGRADGLEAVMSALGCQGAHIVDRRLLQTACAAAVMFVLLAAGSATAQAATPTWLPGETIEPLAQAEINGLACPTSTTCLAAASNTPIVQDDAKSYEPTPDPDPSGVLNALSCAPGTDFCMFVD